MEDFIGTIKIFAGNYAPINYMKCEGQSINIRDNAALFSLLGTTYGGDGRNTFLLPDLRGRLIIDSGQGQRLTYRARGDKGGEETVKLTLSNIPPHKHTFSAISGNRESSDPRGNYLGTAASKFYATAKDSESDTFVKMAAGAVGTIGGKGHENMPPFLCLTYIICINGIYPPRPEW